MKNDRRYAGQGWKRVTLGVGVGFVVMLVGTALFAALIHNELLERAHMGLAAAAVLVAGGFLGAMCSGGGEGRFVRSAATALVLAMILLTVNLILSGGSWGGVLPGMAALFGSAVSAALIRRDGSRRRRYRKYGNR